MADLSSFGRMIRAQPESRAVSFSFRFRDTLEVIRARVLKFIRQTVPRNRVVFGRFSLARLASVVLQAW